MNKHFFKVLIIFIIMIILGLAGVLWFEQIKMNEASVKQVAK